MKYLKYSLGVILLLILGVIIGVFVNSNYLSSNSEEDTPIEASVDIDTDYQEDNTEINETEKDSEEATYTYADLYAWEIQDGYVEITRYLGTDNGKSELIVEIPAELDNLPVKYIGERAFAYLPDSDNAGVSELLEEVVIPDTVSVIGIEAFAFGGNITESIDFGKGVETIKDRAFMGTGFSDLTTPSSLKQLGIHVFSDTKNLKNANLNFSRQLNVLSEATFFDSSLELIILPNQLEVIEPYAIANTQVTGLFIPLNTRSISIYAFGSGNTIENIHFGNVNISNE